MLFFEKLRGPYRKPKKSRGRDPKLKNLSYNTVKICMLFLENSIQVKYCILAKQRHRQRRWNVDHEINKKVEWNKRLCRSSNHVLLSVK